MRLDRECGYITVFLSLILGIFLSFGLTCLEAVRGFQARARAEQSISAAAEHTLADYNIELAKRYDIYFIDETYNGKGREEWITRTQEHLDIALNPIAGFLSFSIQDVDIENRWNIMDQSGSALKEQIQKLPILVGKKAVKRKDSTSSNQKDTFPDLEETEGEPDPRGFIELVRSFGVLKLVYEGAGNLSKENVFEAERPSTQSWQDTVNMPQDAIFHEKLVQRAKTIDYIMDHFNSALTLADSEEKSRLFGEIEYILCGKNNDYDNLTAIVHKLTTIRTPINYAYLATDEAKKGEAFAMAVALCAGQVEIAKPVQYAIMGAWSYGESLMDVKLLLSGEKVPAVKSSSTWNLSLTQLIHIEKALPHNTSKESDQKGLSYLDYLKLFLASQTGKTKYMRMLDVIELNLKIENPQFAIKHCIHSYQVNANIKFSPKFGSVLFLPRTFYMIRTGRLISYS